MENEGQVKSLLTLKHANIWSYDIIVFFLKR